MVDRVIQQAIAQELSPVFEEQFSDNSFGFRPGKGAHDALEKCRKYADEGYVYVVSTAKGNKWSNPEREKKLNAYVKG